MDKEPLEYDIFEASSFHKQFSPELIFKLF